MKLTETQRKVLTFLADKPHGPDAIAEHLWGKDKSGRAYLTASRILSALQSKGLVGVAVVRGPGFSAPHDPPITLEYVSRDFSYGPTEAGRKALT